MMGVSFVLLLTAIFLHTIEGNSNLSSYGSEFYLAFPRSINGALNLTFTVHTLKTTSVQFTITAANNGFTYTGTTTAGNPDTVTIPTSYEVLGNHRSYRNHGLRITSLETEPISVVGWSEHNIDRNFMSYLGLPSHTQPTNQYVYYGVSTLGLNDFWGYILLVGCYNNTNVTVTPSQYANVTMLIDPQFLLSAERTYMYGETNTFILHAGQTVYLYQAHEDLSGTKITSDAPLSVICGHLFSRVPVDYFNVEPIVTQVPPTITWGKEFLLSPHRNRNNGQFYKIIAHRNNTFIERKCGETDDPVNTTLISGQVYSFYTNYLTYCSVVSDKPIYIAQVGVSTLYGGGSYGDPTLNSVPPIDQYLHSIEITPFFVTLARQINILIPNDQYFDNHLIYNGQKYYNLTWTKTIYYPNGSIAGYGLVVDIGGTRIVRHSNPLGKLFVSVYGWTTIGGYSYSGGMGLNPINPTLPFPQVSFTSEQYSVIEGDSVVITLNRSVNTEESVSVRMSVTPLQVDTAKVGEDYQSVSVIVSFEYEEVIKTVNISTVNDNLVEPSEYFTVSLYAIGEEVVVFPITESVVQIIDNDYLEIGFSGMSHQTIYNETEVSFQVITHYGVLQSDEMVRVLLQIEHNDIHVVDIGRFDFYRYSQSYIATVDLNNLSFLNYSHNNTATIVGKLTLSSSTVNTTIHPSIVTIINVRPSSIKDNVQQVTSSEYDNFVLSSTNDYVSSSAAEDKILSSTNDYVLSSTKGNILPSTDNIIYTSSSFQSSKTISSTASFITLSTRSNSIITATNSIISLTRSIATPATVSIALQETNCVSMAIGAVNSSIIVGVIFGYVILILLCGIGIVGGFLCGRKTIPKNEAGMSNPNYCDEMKNIDDVTKGADTMVSDMIQPSQDNEIKSAQLASNKENETVVA